MTPQEIKTFFELIIDDSPDEDITYGIMDSAYTKRNEQRVWEMLKKLDTSITHTPGDTWETQKSLPSDFARPHKVFAGTTGENEYQGVLFEEILRYKDSADYYAIDIANSKMRLTGSVSQTLTIYLWYLYAPTSLFGLSETQKTSETTIVWPARFHRLLAYDMAALYFGGIDADEITRRMSPEHKLEAKMLAQAMIAWDDSMKRKSMGGSAAPQTRIVTEKPDVIDW